MDSVIFWLMSNSREACIVAVCVLLLIALIAELFYQSPRGKN